MSEVGWRVRVVGKSGVFQVWLVAISDKAEAIAAVEDHSGVVPEIISCKAKPSSQNELEALNLKAGQLKLI